MKSKRYYLAYVFVATLVGLSVASCTYEELPVPKVNVPATVSFSKDVQPIFNASCAKTGCHAKGGIPPDLSAGNSFISLTFFGYINIDAPETSLLYDKITNGSMKVHASNQDRAIILAWIKQGALDN